MRLLRVLLSPLYIASLVPSAHTFFDERPATITASAARSVSFCDQALTQRYVYARHVTPRDESRTIYHARLPSVARGGGASSVRAATKESVIPAAKRLVGSRLIVSLAALTLLTNYLLQGQDIHAMRLVAHRPSWWPLLSASTEQWLFGSMGGVIAIGAAILSDVRQNRGRSFWRAGSAAMLGVFLGLVSYAVWNPGDPEQDLLARTIDHQFVEVASEARQGPLEVQATIPYLERMKSRVYESYEAIGGTYAVEWDKDERHYFNGSFRLLTFAEPVRGMLRFLNSLSGNDRRVANEVMKASLIKEAATIGDKFERPYAPRSFELLDQLVLEALAPYARGNTVALPEGILARDERLRELLKTAAAMRLRGEAVGYVAEQAYLNSRGISLESLGRLEQMASQQGNEGAANSLYGMSHRMQFGRKLEMDAYRRQALVHGSALVRALREGRPVPFAQAQVVQYMLDVERDLGRTINDPNFLGYLTDPHYNAVTPEQVTERFGAPKRPVLWLDPPVRGHEAFPALPQSKALFSAA